MNLSNKGQSSVVDILLLSMIVVIAAAFLHIYSATHQSTGSKDLKQVLSTEYASRALMMLSYVNSPDASYETVQSGTVTNVSDPDLSGIVNVSLRIRGYTAYLGQTLANWSENITKAHDPAKAGMEGIRGNISDLENGLAEQKDSLTSGLSTAETDCAGLIDAMNKYYSIIGAASISPASDPCGYVKDLNSTVSGTYQGVGDKLAELDGKITEVEGYLDTDQEKTLKAIQEARCLLKEINVKNDMLISYAQLGVRSDTTLIDLFPAKASLETKTVTETVGESLYIEDRLATSDATRMLGATGVRMILSEQGISPGDAKSQILQAAVLTFARKEYRELAQKSVEASLDGVLTKQGYKYCFTARNCCNQVTAGVCDKIPENAVRAERSSQAMANETGTMTLAIWR